MIYNLNIKRFILVFAICTVIFTPLLIRAHNNALNSVEPTNPALEDPVVHLVQSFDNVSVERGVKGNTSDLARFSGGRQQPLVGHPSLKPKISNR